MSYRQIVILLIVSLTIICGSYLLTDRSESSLAGPAKVSIDLEDARSMTGIKTTEERIEFWRHRFERNSQDYISLTHLGHAYILKARETGDVSLYERAETALHEALDLNPTYKTALAYMAVVHFAQHEFQAALDLATGVYDLDRRAIQALATIGDAHLELGNYAEAEAAYQQLADRNLSPPVHSRLARLAWLQGQPEEALRLLQLATTEAKELGLSGGSLAWYHLQLAEIYFNTGRISAAESEYMAALRLYPDYYVALAGLGKIRAAQGDYEAAIEFYQKAVAIIPQPDFLATLGDLYRLVGQSDQAQRQYDTVEYIGQLAEINQQVYNRQLANFYADHDLSLDRALTLALAELEIRRDIYSFDTAAWAYFKKGRLDEAQQMIEQALQLGTRDARLYYHAGMIAHAQGRLTEAEQLLNEALAINPYFDILQADKAQQIVTSYSS